MHTNWTDGRNSVNEMIIAAMSAGLEWIMFSEHNRSDSRYSYKSFIEEIEQSAKKNPGIILIKGAECKIKNFEGEIDISLEAKSLSDMITGVVHRFPGEKSIDKYPYSSYTQSQKEEAFEIEKRLTLNGIKTGEFKVLGHPFGMTIKRFGYLPDLRFFKEIILACNESNIIFEVNLRYHLQIIDKLIDLLNNLDADWTIGSNSHSKAELINTWKSFRSREIK